MTRSPKITRACPFCGEAEYLRLDEGTWERSPVINGVAVHMYLDDDNHAVGAEYVDSVNCLTCDTMAALDTWNGTRPAEHYALLRDWDEEPALT